MALEDAVPASMFEFYAGPDGAWPKKVDPVRKGLALRYFIALVEGVTTRFGGRLTLFNETNKGSADLGMAQDTFTIRVLGREVFTVSRGTLQVPALEIGKPGASYLVMHDGPVRRYVSVENNKLVVRATQPGA